MAIRNEILERIKKTGRYPFLFVGAGMSQRYAQAKNWEGLLRYFCTEFSGNEFQYDVYAKRVSEEDYYGKQPKIAQLLEKDYDEAVLTQEKYRNFREKHKNEIKAGVSALKIAVAEYCLDQTLTGQYEEEIKLFEEAAKKNLSGIITTNYDALLEQICKDYEVYVGQKEIVFADIYEYAEIYKIHGSAFEPESIVLTSEDYKKIEETEPYLVAKIMTIFLEYPVIFMGYSVQDKDIQNILQSISVCLDQKHIEMLKDRLIFVEYAEGDTIESISYSFANKRQIEMTRIKTRDFKNIFQALLEVETTYSPKVLRQLKKQIYEMVNVAQPNGQIQASGFEGLEKLGEEGKFIIAVGTNRGPARIIKAEEIYEDIIFDNKYFNPQTVVKEYLPELLKSNSGGLPMYKYLDLYQEELFGKVKENVLKHDRIDTFLNEQLRIQKNSYRREFPDISVEKIIEKEGKEVAYRKMCFLEKEEINLKHMLKYLSELLKEKGVSYLKNNSELKRLIRIYDWTKYNSIVR